MNPQVAPATTTGGNTVIRNGDEQETLSRTVAGVPVRVEGFKADDSHINPQFREAEIG